MMGKSFLISVRRTDTGRRKGDEGGTINSPLTLERTSFLFAFFSLIAGEFTRWVACEGI